METFEGQNWAVLKSVKVIQRSYISFLEYSNPIDFSSISITSGQNFEEIPFILESAGFQDIETNPGENDLRRNFWDKKIRLTIPKLRSEVTAFLKNYEDRDLAFLVTDMNNEMHLVYPLQMTRQRNIPGQAISLNATIVEFAGRYHLPAFHVSDYSSG